MSVLAKAHKLGAVSDRLIRSLLVPTSGGGGQILFVQEGVSLKGSSSHDAQSFLGTFFIAADPSGSIHVLWLPYSYVFAIDPMLVSPATKHSLALDSTTTTTAAAASSTSSTATAATQDKTEDGEMPMCVMRAEWLFAQCIPFETVGKIRCKTTMRGKRVVTLHRMPALNPDNVSDFPLTFFDGGVEKLLAVLGSFATVQAAPGGSPDELVVTHPQQRAISIIGNSGAASSSSLAGGAAAGDKMQEFRDHMYSDKASSSSAAAKSSSASADKNKKVGARVWGGIVGLVSRGGKFLAEHFLDDDEIMQVNAASVSENKPRVGGAAGGNGSGDDFDLMQPLQPIEEVKPKLCLPAQMPARGPKLTHVQWDSCFGPGGVLDVDQFTAAREMIFAGGMEDSIRPDVWKWLLGVYPPDSTAVARRNSDEEAARLYDAVYQQWSSILPEQERRFAAYRERKVAVDKDVTRTDRSHRAFADDGSEKLGAMRRILMTYSMWNFDLGYCQGMSDALAVLLLVYPNGSDAEIFTVFRALMEKMEGNFSNGSSHTMARQLRAVEVLTHAFIPPLYSHLQAQQATNMCFCFRWLLVLFKREFSDIDQICRIWDVIFACPFSDRYEIILVVAMLRAASEQIIDHAMSFDELIKYTNSLCGALRSEQELLQAGADLYQFAQSQHEWSKKTVQQQKSGGAGREEDAGEPTSPTRGGNSVSSPIDRVGNPCGRPSVKELCDTFASTMDTE